MYLNVTTCIAVGSVKRTFILFCFFILNKNFVQIPFE